MDAPFPQLGYVSSLEDKKNYVSPPQGWNLETLKKYGVKPLRSLEWTSQYIPMCHACP